MNTPSVISDPRFRAGCKLVKTGKAHCGAIELFAALVEESRNQFGEASLNSAASYYEYGHALFRAACRRDANVNANVNVNVNVNVNANGNASKNENENDSKAGKVKYLDRKPRAVENDDATVEVEGLEKEEGKQKQLSPAGSQQQMDQNEGDDVQLALELMENSWAILDEYVQSHNHDSTNTKGALPESNDSSNPKNKNYDKERNIYLNWAKDQQPRILLGIGDVFDHLNKYGDAVDAYTRAIPLREQFIPQKQTGTHCSPRSASGPSIQFLKRRRQLVEVLVLVAETLLKCPKGADVLTSETKVLLVTDLERVDFARGYYDKAKEELQETVFLMGKLASHDIIAEKEDICFIATMLMGVGTTLAEIDEEQGRTVEESSTAKKPKI